MRNVFWPRHAIHFCDRTANRAGANDVYETANENYSPGILSGESKDETCALRRSRDFYAQQNKLRKIENLNHRFRYGPRNDPVLRIISKTCKRRSNRARNFAKNLACCDFGTTKFALSQFLISIAVSLYILLPTNR